MILILSTLSCITFNLKSTNAKEIHHVLGEKKIDKINPSQISFLPKHIISELTKRKCLIPQTFQYNHSKYENVIKGEFEKTGQKDWAILCSQNGFSSILIFWNSSLNRIAEIAKQKDSAYLQGVSGINGKKFGYSRKISVAQKYYVERKLPLYKGLKLTIKHQGIDDAFLMKSSEIHYYFNKKLFLIPGAD